MHVLFPLVLASNIFDQFCQSGAEFSKPFDWQIALKNPNPVTFSDNNLIDDGILQDLRKMKSTRVIMEDGYDLEARFLAEAIRKRADRLEDVLRDAHLGRWNGGLRKYTRVLKENCMRQSVIKDLMGLEGRGNRVPLLAWLTSMCGFTAIAQDHFAPNLQLNGGSIEAVCFGGEIQEDIAAPLATFISNSLVFRANPPHSHAQLVENLISLHFTHLAGKKMNWFAHGEILELLDMTPQGHQVTLKLPGVMSFLDMQKNEDGKWLGVQYSSKAHQVMAFLTADIGTFIWNATHPQNQRPNSDQMKELSFPWYQGGNDFNGMIQSYVAAWNLGDAIILGALWETVKIPSIYDRSNSKPLNSLGMVKRLSTDSRAALKKQLSTLPKLKMRRLQPHSNSFVVLL